MLNQAKCPEMPEIYIKSSKKRADFSKILVNILSELNSDSEMHNFSLRILNHGKLSNSPIKSMNLQVTLREYYNFFTIFKQFYEIW